MSKTQPRKSLEYIPDADPMNPPAPPAAMVEAGQTQETDSSLLTEPVEAEQASKSDLIRLGEQDELAALKRKVIRRDGKPKKNAQGEDLRRFMLLSAIYEPIVKQEHAPPPLHLAPAGTLRRAWQGSERLRYLLTQELEIRQGISKPEQEQAQAEIDKYK